MNSWGGYRVFFMWRSWMFGRWKVTVSFNGGEELSGPGFAFGPLTIFKPAQNSKKSL
jgi:hypothetical protein